MEQGRIIQGRVVSTDDIEVIRSLIATHPTWHRTRLSQELCQRWDWVAASGALKDMAARALLRKLHAQGLIELPAPIRSSHNASRRRTRMSVTVDRTPIAGTLGELRPIQVVTATDDTQARLFRALLQTYHYQGYSGPVGENLKYLVYDRQGRALACVLFAAPAWHLACRDRFIGWERAARERRLSLLANNMRFLILPWVHVPHLASHVLAHIARRISRDWQSKYAHRLVLLETFVDPARFVGTCYRAANWRFVGHTQGRSRNDRHKTLRVPVKSVYLYPLTRHYRTWLCRGGA